MTKTCGQPAGYYKGVDNQLACKFVSADPKIPLSFPSRNTVKTGISCPQPTTQLRHTLNFRDFFAPPLRKNKPLRVKGGQPAGLPKSFWRFPSGLVFVFFLHVLFFCFFLSLFLSVAFVLVRSNVYA